MYDSPLTYVNRSGAGRIFINSEDMVMFGAIEEIDMLERDKWLIREGKKAARLFFILCKLESAMRLITSSNEFLRDISNSWNAFLSSSIENCPR